MERDSLDVLDVAACELWALRPEVPQAFTGLFLAALGVARTRSRRGVMPARRMHL